MCSAPDETSLLPTYARLRDHLRRGGGEIARARGQGEPGWSLFWTRQDHCTQELSSCACIRPTPDQASQHSRMEWGRVRGLYPSCRAVGWLLREGYQEALGGLAMLW